MTICPTAPQSPRLPWFPILLISQPHVISVEPHWTVLMRNLEWDGKRERMTAPGPASDRYAYLCGCPA